MDTGHAAPADTDVTATEGHQSNRPQDQSRGDEAVGKEHRFIGSAQQQADGTNEFHVCTSDRRSDAQRSAMGTYENHPSFGQGGPANWHSIGHNISPQSGGLQLRPSIKDSMSPSSGESSQFGRPLQMPVAESRQEEEFLLSLALPGLMARGSAPRFQHDMAMHTEGGAPRLTPRVLYSSEEATMYGNYHGREGQLRKSRTSMQPPTAPSDLRLGMHAGVSGSPGAGHVVSHTSDGSPQVVGSHGSEDYRESGRVGASPMAPVSSLQRSASEGGVRSMGHMAAHQRTGSGGSLQDDRLLVRMGGEQSMNLMAPRDSPDFAMIYAFLGSMFDPVCSMINHHDVLTQMCDVDRETSILLLSNISANLDSHGHDIFGRFLSNAAQPQRAHEGGAHP